MSYYLDPNYYKNVPSYDESDIGLPMVGCGKSARAAGPELIGVGLVAMPRASRVAVRTTPPPVAEESWFPWWGWMAVPLAVGGAALFAADMGWLGRKAKTVAAGG
jgi:hypothetical protein